MRDGNEQTRDPGTEMSDSPKGREERSSTPPTELPTLGNTEVDPGDGTAMLDSPTEPPDLQEGTTPEMLTDSQEDELEAAELDAEVQDQPLSSFSTLPNKPSVTLRTQPDTPPQLCSRRKPPGPQRPPKTQDRCIYGDDFYWSTGIQ